MTRGSLVDNCLSYLALEQTLQSGRSPTSYLGCKAVFEVQWLTGDVTWVPHIELADSAVLDEYFEAMCYDPIIRSIPYVIFSHDYLSGPRNALRM